MAKKILQKEAQVLRETAVEVPVEDILTTKIQKILSEMKEALDSQEDGVAIAAPQIGYSLRIFLVSRKVEKMVDGKEEEPEAESNLAKDLVFINPKIKKISKEKKFVEEGCLSVRYLYGKVKRSIKTSVEAYDENGKKFTRGGTGLFAQIFQHEIDHLDGILFIDSAKNIEEIIPEHLISEYKNTVNEKQH